MTQDIFLLVRSIAAGTFDAKEEDITLESSPQTLENWDSIQHLNFILALETKFDTHFSADEMESMRCIGDAVNTIATKSI